MSDWVHEGLVAAGARSRYVPYDERTGGWGVEFRGFYLDWGWDYAMVARARDFDRWANSRIWAGEPWTTPEEALARLAEIEANPDLHPTNRPSAVDLFIRHMFGAGT